MRVDSALNPDRYLDAMKERMGGHFEFGRERYTGFFLGKAFSITHHSGAEWNRRITNEKNTAVGFVRETEDGCSVFFIRCKGLLSPPLFLTTFGIMFLILLVGALVQTAVGTITLQVFLKAAGLCAVICFAVTLVSALCSAFAESLTQAGQEGRRILNALLLDPTDMFSYANNENQLDF